VLPSYIKKIITIGFEIIEFKKNLQINRFLTIFIYIFSLYILQILKNKLMEKI